ncbi:MAG: YfiR family protein [Pseudomonadota bacterium]
MNRSTVVLMQAARRAAAPWPPAPLPALLALLALPVLRRLAFLPGLLVLLLVSWPAPARAQAPAPASLALQVKAAYLYKFAGFVEWPEGSFARADSPLVIAVAGADALAEQLEQSVAGRSANGHPLLVRRLRRGEAPGPAHILFLGALERGATQELLAAAQNQAMLTVSDSAEAHALGSMVNFVTADERLRFEVALRPAAGARLKISARMLSAAYKVQGAT